MNTPITTTSTTPLTARPWFLCIFITLMAVGVMVGAIALWLNGPTMHGLLPVREEVTSQHLAAAFPLGSTVLVGDLATPGTVVRYSFDALVILVPGAGVVTITPAAVRRAPTTTAPSTSPPAHIPQGSSAP